MVVEGDPVYLSQRGEKMNPYFLAGIIAIVCGIFILTYLYNSRRYRELLFSCDQVVKAHDDYVKLHPHVHDFALTHQYAMVSDNNFQIVAHIRVLRCKNCHDLKEVRIITSDPLPPLQGRMTV